MEKKYASIGKNFKESSYIWNQLPKTLTFGKAKIKNMPKGGYLYLTVGINMNVHLCFWNQIFGHKSAGWKKF